MVMNVAFGQTTAADYLTHMMGACRVLIASIMEEFDRGAWEELIERCEESGVDGFEVNFSCPHGMPERKMGMAMGQDPEILQVLQLPNCAASVGSPCCAVWVAQNT